MRPLALVLPAALLVASCGDEPADDPAPDAGEAPLLEAPPAGAGRQLTLGVTLAAGEEIERCQYVVVDDAIEVARFEHVYSTGSHHLLVYQTGLAAADAPAAPFDCTGAQFTELGVTGIAYAAQVPDGELAYPEGVALKIPGGTVLLVQTHYLNATPGPLDAEVFVNLWYTESPATAEAGTMFFYDWAIVVPAGEAATARMRCAVPEDVNLLFGMSHMHRRGVDYRAVLAGEGEPVTLFETQDWEGIEPERYAPSLPVAGGSVIDFQCHYQGEDGRTIIEGPSAENNEMCMFIAAYYPRLDPAVELCGLPGSGPVFDGATTCGETVTCVRGAADAVAAEACIVDTCEASSTAAADLMQCMFFTCGEECADLGSDCDTCVLSSCGEAYTACTNAGC